MKLKNILKTKNTQNLSQCEPIFYSNADKINTYPLTYPSNTHTLFSPPKQTTLKQ